MGKSVFQVVAWTQKNSKQPIAREIEEELSNGLKLVDVNIKEAIFQKGENSFVSLNFKNQIRERDEF